MACDCRKPKAGMLFQGAADFGLNLSRCYLVGDKVSDLEAAGSVGCASVLVRTGHGAQVDIQRAGRELEPGACGGEPTRGGAPSVTENGASNALSTAPLGTPFRLWPRLYSTVTLFARLRGLSTSQPRSTAM